MILLIHKALTMLAAQSNLTEFLTMNMSVALSTTH